jgi:hypothetical protein
MSLQELKQQVAAQVSAGRSLRILSTCLCISISSMIYRCWAEMVLRTQLTTQLRIIISGGYCGTACCRTIKLSRYISERGRS